jgi:uncharacterized membrane-anchored protein
VRLKAFVLVLALQTIWLLGMVVAQERGLANGKVILLETERVDPRDLLRGDYLILNYKISNVATNLFMDGIDDNLRDGTRFYVAVTPDTNGFYVVSRASTRLFNPTPNEVRLKAHSTSRWWNSGNSIHVDYGLERFYVAEGTGNPSGKLTVQAVVSRSGSAQVKEVFVDGKPYAEAMKATR